MLLLLALLPSASAFDDASLRSAASFGLFRDEYDYLQEPATLGEQEGRHLYTLLGNQGGSNRFTLGGLGEAGPGVVGALADYGRVSSATSNTQTSAATASTPDTVTKTRSSVKTTSLSGYLGYGVHLGDALSVGAGVEWSESSTLSTVTPNPSGSPVIGGGLENTTAGDEDLLVETGSSTARQIDGRAIVGVAYGAPRIDVEADFTLGRVSQSTTLTDVYLKKGTIEYSADGFPEGSGMSANAEGVLPGLVVDATGHVSDHLDVRLLVEGARGGVKPVVAERFEGYSDDAQPDLDWSVDETLSKPDMTVGNEHVLLAAHFAADATLVRFGVEWTGDDEDLAATSDVASDFGGTSTDVAWREHYVQRYRAVSLPVAVEVPAGDRWTVRVGGRWATAALTFDQHDVLKTDAAEGDATDLHATERDANAYVELATGFRYTPVHWFSLDAVASGTGRPVGRAAIDLTQVLVSGVFHL